MEWVAGVITFLFGTSVGSFLNVVVFRTLQGKPLRGRSQCPACKVQLRWFELIPLVSFFLQRGRCRSCGILLSWQYPVVELLCGIGFSVVAIRWLQARWALQWEGVVWLALMWGVIAISLALAAYDVRTRAVPTHWLGMFTSLSFLAGLLSRVVEGQGSFVTALSEVLLSGVVVALPFWGLWLISRGKWIGDADGWLAFGIGAFLGVARGITAILLAFWAGALAIGIMWGFHRFLQLFRGEYAMRLHSRLPAIRRGMAVPFVPFLTFGLWVELAFPFAVFALY